MGSNMAEAHPVGFQWVMEAKGRGAKIFHVDPRFTRTSALADRHVPIRAGSDIAFLGGIVSYILENGREFRDYVRHYTNGPVIITEEFADTEDLDGFFSGWNSDDGAYEIDSWRYADTEQETAAGKKEQDADVSGEQAHGVHGINLNKGEPPETDPDMEHPRCVFQLLKHHYSRYTPEVVERLCGIPREQFLEVAEALCQNSGRERTSAFCYAVGWTQHTVGVQYIRTAAIIQLLLGNIGRPGGGILALRGHASIQGSTDVPTLYNILPGYIAMRHAHSKFGLQDFIQNTGDKYGYWGHLDAYLISLLKAWWGDNATSANEYCFDYLPRLTGDHSAYVSTLRAIDGELEGYLLIGENPAVGNANGKAHRMALANLKWLVVRDFQEIESASFWHDAPEIETGELRTTDIGTEVFFMPAAAHTEKDGTFTNTQRMLQWHHKAVEPPGDSRSDLWFAYHLGRRIREKLAGSLDPKDKPILELTWDYPTEGRHQDPSADAVLKEINGFRVADGKTVSGYEDLEADGSTACGVWIYSGCYAGDENLPARRKPHWDQDTWVAPEWAWTWPMNRHIIYNRASADPEGKPWSERKKYVWWDDEKREWAGFDVPDFKKTMRPDHEPSEDDKAEWRLRGDEPFIMQSDGKGWLYVPSGLTDGPMPTHYEPHESPFSNPLYKQQANPVRQRFHRKDNPYNPTHGDPGA